MRKCAIEGCEATAQGLVHEWCSLDCPVAVARYERRQATKTQADSVAFKDDKVPMELIDLDFVHNIALQFKGGLVGGRVPDGWKDLDPAVYREKCYGAALRHMTLARHGHRELDSATKATHLAAVCANMMMVWWFEGELAEQFRTAGPEMDGLGAGGSS